MNNSFMERFLAPIVLALLTVIFIGYLFMLDGVLLDPGDGMNHYLIAKYSWTNPALFLDHWGKPIFTLLSSPFAQLGFNGMLLFNIFLFVITGVVLLKTSKILNLNYQFLTVVFCFIAPVYFRDVLSGLTEVLFATILIVSVYFYLKKWFFLGTVIISFSLLARPESAVVLPIFATYLLVKKQFKWIPMLLTGAILFGFVGWLAGKSFLWVLTESPYASGSTYGSGNLFHFVKNWRNTLGIPLTLSVVLGVFAVLRSNPTKAKENKPFAVEKILLIIGPVVAVLLTHSILWWQGMQGSAGLLRVLATIVPCAAILGLIGINELLNILAVKFKLAKGIIFLLAIGVSTIFVIKRVWKLEQNSNMVAAQEGLDQAAQWYLDQPQKGKIYYMPPYFAYQAKLDPFSAKSKMGNLKELENFSSPSLAIGADDVILWDSQFAPLEGKIALSTLQNDQGLVLVKRFKVGGNAQGEESYQIHFFKKQ